MKKSVTQFDLSAAFKALDEMEYPKVEGGILPNRVDLKENFGSRKLRTDILVEDYYDVNDNNDLEAAAEEREGEVAKAKLARIEKIVDLDAESEDDLLTSYEGKVIIQCPQCMTLFYKNEEDLETDENNPDVVNINETCQHCGNTSGYMVIGKVAPVEEAELDNFDTEDFEEEPVEKTEEKVVEEEPAEEDLDDLDALDLDFDEEKPAEEEANESLNKAAIQKEVDKKHCSENDSKNLTLNEDKSVKNITTDQLCSVTLDGSQVFEGTEDECKDYIDKHSNIDAVKAHGGLKLVHSANVNVLVDEALKEEKSFNITYKIKGGEEQVATLDAEDEEDAERIFLDDYIFNADSYDEDEEMLKPEDVEIVSILEEALKEDKGEAVKQDELQAEHEAPIEEAKKVCEKCEKEICECDKQELKESEIEDVINSVINSWDLGEACEGKDCEKPLKEDVFDNDDADNYDRYHVIKKACITAKEAGKSCPFVGGKWIIDALDADDNLVETKELPATTKPTEVKRVRDELFNNENVIGVYVYRRFKEIATNKIEEVDIEEYMKTKPGYDGVAIEESLNECSGKDCTAEEAIKKILMKESLNKAEVQKDVDKKHCADNDSENLTLNEDAEEEFPKPTKADFDKAIEKRKQQIEKYKKDLAAIKGDDELSQLNKKECQFFIDFYEKDIKDLEARKAKLVESLTEDAEEEFDNSELAMPDKDVEKVNEPFEGEDGSEEAEEAEEAEENADEEALNEQPVETTIGEVKEVAQEVAEKVTKPVEDEEAAEEQAEEIKEVVDDVVEDKFAEEADNLENEEATEEAEEEVVDETEVIEEPVEEGLDSEAELEGFVPVEENLEEAKDEAKHEEVSDAEFKKLVNSPEFEDMLKDPNALEECGINKVFEDVDEADEKAFEECISEALTSTYENVKDFTLTECVLKDDKFIIEGNINFNSGKTRKTQYVFEKAATAEGKAILEGYNKGLSKEGNFRVNCLLKESCLVPQSMSYRYNIEETLVEGLATRK